MKKEFFRGNDKLRCFQMFKNNQLDICSNSEVFSNLSGDEWQDLGNALIGLKYGPANYQRVPDNDRGDAGIEGFT
ncbi:MAG: hypothetical protein LBG80_09075, partial [Bacteroidales bacterium]|nr:hypothetical protein [Bacteroidales bacterium]